MPAVDLVDCFFFMTTMVMDFWSNLLTVFISGVITVLSLAPLAFLVFSSLLKMFWEVPLVHLFYYYQELALRLICILVTCSSTSVRLTGLNNNEYQIAQGKVHFYILCWDLKMRYFCDSPCCMKMRYVAARKGKFINCFFLWILMLKLNYVVILGQKSLNTQSH